jgi:hypothetical protein
LKHRQYPKIWLPAAGCSGSIAASAYDLPARNGAVPNCYGTSYRFGALDFIKGGAQNPTALLHLKLPGDWVVGSPISASLYWLTGGIAQSVQWGVSAACFGDSTDVLNPTFVPLLAAPTVSGPAANTRTTTAFANIISLSPSCLTAGDRQMIVQIWRNNGDASTLKASLLGIELTVRRAP